VAVKGGPPLTLADTSAPTGAWLPDNTILFTRTEAGIWSLFRVSAAGGTATRITTPAVDQKEQRHGWPDVLPDGKHILMSVTTGGTDFNQSHIAVLSLDTGKYRTVIEQGYHARYVSSGYIVYSLGANLMAVPFDASRLVTTGPPGPIVEGVRSRTSTGEICFGVSSTGFLVYAPGAALSGSQRTLVWVDRNGKEEPLPAPPRSYAYPRLSPDGTRIAIDIRDQGGGLWVWDLTRRTLTRLTFDGTGTSPTWTPDGKRIIFASQSTGVGNLYWQAADGTGQPERLVESALAQVPQSVSRDGRLVFRQSDPKTNFDLYTLPLSGERRPTPLIRTPFVEQGAEVSPNGRWVAYASDESGYPEIYVRPFPNAASGRWQISPDGGARPVWSRDGRELFYQAGRVATFRFMAAAVSTDELFSAATPQMLFEGSYFVGQINQGRPFDVSLDGKRFLLIKDPATESGAPGDAPLVIVLNLFNELRRLVPAKQ
jgi:serine/threonine-protein kinase